MKEKLLNELDSLLEKAYEMFLYSARNFLRKDDYDNIISMLEKLVDNEKNETKPEKFKYYVKCLGFAHYSKGNNTKAKKYFDYLEKEYDDKDGIIAVTNHNIGKQSYQSLTYSKEELYQYKELDKKFSPNIQKLQSTTTTNENSGNTYFSRQTLVPNIIFIDPSQEHIIKNKAYRLDRNSKKQKINTSIYTIVNQKAIFLDSYYASLKEQSKKDEMVDISGSLQLEDGE